MFKLIYKKRGISSFKAINNFKKENNIKKIGHTGTLDPLAQGLLLVATDDDTKLIPYIHNKDKSYRVCCKLGFVSKTYDSEGPIEFYSNECPTLDTINNVLGKFKGKIKQKPPIFSSKKVNGKRAYNLARNNQSFELQDIYVKIYDIYDIKYEYPNLSFSVDVSNGTYIRSLINDIGIELKTGAYITFLERVMVNGLTKSNEIINVDKLLGLDEVEIETIDELQNWFNGKIKNVNLSDGNFVLKFKCIIIGIIQIKDNIIFKTNLFGNRIIKIIEGR